MNLLRLKLTITCRCTPPGRILWNVGRVIPYENDLTTSLYISLLWHNIVYNPNTGSKTCRGPFVIMTLFTFTIWTYNMIIAFKQKSKRLFSIFPCTYFSNVGGGDLFPISQRHIDGGYEGGLTALLWICTIGAHFKYTIDTGIQCTKFTQLWIKSSQGWFYFS